MTKKWTKIWAIFLLISLVGCDKWLNVSTENKVPIDRALSDRNGFTEALAGIYAQMGAESLYGRELEFGLLDVLAGYWEISPDHPYDPDYQFGYNRPSVNAKIVAIWSGLYSCIHQCNLLLDHIDNINNDPSYQLIKGEVLGLRAFFHLELFRLYGPVVAESGLDTPAIPYYDRNTKTIQPVISSRECLNKVEIDLQASKNLLKEDPIIVLGREGNGNNSDDLYANALIDRRGIRMNYYAILALLARKAQWEGDLQSAKLRAEELIDLLNKSQAIYFTPAKIRQSLSNQSYIDRRLSCENIFGLYINDIEPKTAPFFNSLGDQKLKPAYNLLIKRKYEEGTGSRADYRWRLWRVDSYPFLKFIHLAPNSEVSEKERARQFEVSIINLSELYFIAAEAWLEQDVGKSLELINTVRINRDLLPVQLSSSQAYEQVKQLFLDETCREYIGEGHIFLLHKHLAYGVYRLGGIMMLPEPLFQLPIPTSENL